tara:strand:- start:598 stop:894 length:297 start_codon:yes stop_codon:yes gene_type:complete
MNYNFQSINFNPKNKLLLNIKNRTRKLSLFYDKIISVNIYAKLINSNRKNKEVEFILRIPGEEFVVKKTSDSFERSVKRVANSIERLLINHKKKLSKI